MFDNLWLHFARQGPDITPPIITRGDGVTIFDDAGNSYLDGLSGLFTVQVGHGRAELAQAAARQAETLAFFPLWGYATPPAIELSERLAATLRANSTGCSSPVEVRRPSRPHGRWPSSISS